MPYAENSKVGVDRTVEQIRKVLSQYGGTGFGYMSDSQQGVEQIMFRVPSSEGVALEIKYQLPLPSPSDFALTASGRRRKSESAAQEAFDQAVRSLWRLAYISIKSKLEMTRRGLTVIEREFFHDIVVPGSGGRTVGDIVKPQLERAYTRGLPSGEAPLMLSSPGSGRDGTDQR